MICPNCSGDYLDGVNVCVTCHVLLVKDSSCEHENGNGNLVHFITYLSRYEAAAGKNLLECFDIDAIVSIDELWGIRLWVKKEDAHKAVKIFQKNTLEGKNTEKIH